MKNSETSIKIQNNMNYKDMYKINLYLLLKILKYSKLQTRMSIKSIIIIITIDPSDSDLDVPNSIHAYQTAERKEK